MGLDLDVTRTRLREMVEGCSCHGATPTTAANEATGTSRPAVPVSKQ